MIIDIERAITIKTNTQEDVDVLRWIAYNALEVYKKNSHKYSDPLITSPFMQKTIKHEDIEKLCMKIMKI